MNNDTDHILLTRFNLPSVGVESLIRAHDGWLHSRVDLFEKYCLPSVRAQTQRDFAWIIYFDPESPEWLLRWIDSHRAEGVFHPVFRATVSRQESSSDMADLIGTPRPRLLTTNLDNDDAIARDFVERLGSVGPIRQRTALYFSNGLIATRHRVYSRRDKHNAFCSVVESWDDPVTCWADWHNRLGRTMSVKTIGGPPAWLQVVHGSNVSNRVRGRLIAPDGYQGLFGDLLADEPPPSRTEMLADHAVFGPLRATKEGVRAVARWGALSVLGTSGLDRIKERLAQMRNRHPRMGERSPLAEKVDLEGR
jgi:hypothetical protein